MQFVNTDSAVASCINSIGRKLDLAQCITNLCANKKDYVYFDVSRFFHQFTTTKDKRCGSIRGSQGFMDLRAVCVLDPLSVTGNDAWVKGLSERGKRAGRSSSLRNYASIRVRAIPVASVYKRTIVATEGERVRVGRAFSRTRISECIPGCIPTPPSCIAAYRDSRRRTDLTHAMRPGAYCGIAN